MRKRNTTKIDVTHAKNPAAGWDVEVTVTAEEKESVARVKIVIKVSPSAKSKLQARRKSGTRYCCNKGTIRGRTKAVVTVVDQKGEESTAVEEWE